jgi:hypothetical protein
MRSALSDVQLTSMFASVSQGRFRANATLSGTFVLVYQPFESVVQHLSPPQASCALPHVRLQSAHAALLPRDICSFLHTLIAFHSLFCIAVANSNATYSLLSVSYSAPCINGASTRRPRLTRPSPRSTCSPSAHPKSTPDPRAKPRLQPLLRNSSLVNPPRIKSIGWRPVELILGGLFGD